jgi:hypothetical protein
MGTRVGMGIEQSDITGGLNIRAKSFLGFEITSRGRALRGLASFAVLPRYRLEAYATLIRLRLRRLGPQPRGIFELLCDRQEANNSTVPELPTF